MAEASAASMRAATSLRGHSRASAKGMVGERGATMRDVISHQQAHQADVEHTAEAGGASILDVISLPKEPQGCV